MKLGNRNGASSKQVGTIYYVLNNKHVPYKAVVCNPKVTVNCRRPENLGSQSS